jgi:hypothetical protein
MVWLDQNKGSWLVGLATCVLDVRLAQSRPDMAQCGEPPTKLHKDIESNGFIFYSSLTGLFEETSTSMTVHESQAYREPLKKSGALDKYEYEDTTPIIGREFINVNIVDDLLNSPGADALLKDLAITSTLNIFCTKTIASLYCDYC